ncbi:hypothetical protein F7725_012098 [Dissostichus mawsoni]|uniref:Uncharacterized protein n=1 Tax=Dissostichus mawsoni TaxID=36200 RepID=A0A7J5ZDT9_DISMA|nr:hypothetical protein F7725_012098 [Dissostichus mawsoni]
MIRQANYSGHQHPTGLDSAVSVRVLMSVSVEDDSLNVRSSFDAEISDLEHTVSEPPLPSACSSPVRMQESPFPTSSSSQECLVDLIQPVGRHKQVKRKRDSSSGLLVYLENSDDREEKLQERLQEQGQAMLKEQGQAMLQEVHAANAEFLRVFNRIEQNSHSMLGLVDRIVKRLAVAVEEISGLLETTISNYEEEISRQRRLLSNERSGSQIHTAGS